MDLEALSKNWSKKLERSHLEKKKTVEILTAWWFQPIYGMIIPNIWENKKTFQTTNQI
jgi:hypothetical protein